MRVTVSPAMMEEEGKEVIDMASSGEMVEFVYQNTIQVQKIIS